MLLSNMRTNDLKIKPASFYKDKNLQGHSYH